MGRSRHLHCSFVGNGLGVLPGSWAARFTCRKCNHPNLRPGPDFSALARRLSAPDLLSLLPLERAERHFMSTGHFVQAQSNILLELIRGARNPQRSLTHRTFQELVLGSAEFSRNL